MTATLVPLDPNLHTATGDAQRDDTLRRMAAAITPEMKGAMLDQARSTRDLKMALALHNAERVTEAWGAKALAYLRNYAESHERFVGWHITHAAAVTRAVPKPTSLKAWGSIVTKAQRLGWIEKCGYTTDVNRHCNPIPIYKSLLYRQEAA